MRRKPELSLLAAIPQSPLDSASGAARSTRETCELLARNGWDVRFAGTTTSEDGRNLDLSTLRATYGIKATLHPAGGSFTRRRLTFSYRDVAYTLLDTAGYSIDEARVHLAKDTDALILSETARRSPRVSITYGSSQAEVRRRARLRKQGTRVVFFLRNQAYYHKRSFTHVDAILTPSRFLSDTYFERSGIRSVHLPPCLNPGDVVAPRAERVFCTFVNPTPEKGLLFFLKLVQAAAAIRPDIPFLAVEARGSGSSLVQAGRALGIELKNANLHIANNSPDPRGIYALTRVLLVPSIAPDARPRVIPEAQLNGIPVIGSDRGGIPEAVGSGGFTLPVTDEVSGEESSQLVKLWMELICRLYDAPGFYKKMCRESHQAAAPYRNGSIARMYMKFFRQVLAGQ